MLTFKQGRTVDPEQQSPIISGTSDYSNGPSGSLIDPFANEAYVFHNNDEITLSDSPNKHTQVSNSSTSRESSLGVHKIHKNHILPISNSPAKQSYPQQQVPLSSNPLTSSILNSNNGFLPQPDGAAGMQANGSLYSQILQQSYGCLLYTSDAADD